MKVLRAVLFYLIIVFMVSGSPILLCSFCTVYAAITKYAKRLGYHNSESPRLEDHFGPHCFRHWLTTWLLRNGMPREYGSNYPRYAYLPYTRDTTFWVKW